MTMKTPPEDVFAPLTPTQHAAIAAAEPAKGGAVLERLSFETGVPEDMLRTLAGISDPKNEHMFTAEAARKAFAGVVKKPR